MSEIVEEVKSDKYKVVHCPSGTHNFQPVENYGITRKENTNGNIDIIQMFWCNQCGAKYRMKIAEWNKRSETNLPAPKGGSYSPPNQPRGEQRPQVRRQTGRLPSDS